MATLITSAFTSYASKIWTRNLEYIGQFTTCNSPPHIISSGSCLRIALFNLYLSHLDNLVRLSNSTPPVSTSTSLMS